MQKVSSYLYPNRITVIADVSLFPTRWNIVYQNKIKIYQGVDNVLTLDVKNADQKRIDITETLLEVSITDTNGQALIAVPAIPGDIKGLATVTIPADSLIDVEPQFLKFTVYRINEDLSKTILYADTQFGAYGSMELVGSVTPTGIPTRYITRFHPITISNTSPWITTYYSDAVEIKKPNFLSSAVYDSLAFKFVAKQLSATVSVEFTKDSVVSAGTTWEPIDKFTLTADTSEVTKNYIYPEYSREYTWARVFYVKSVESSGTIEYVSVNIT